MKTLFIPMFGDFDAASRDATNRWFDLDHVPQRLTCPGFFRAERYERVEDATAGPGNTPAPRYLNVYYIENPQVLESEAYRRQVAARTPWSARRTGSGMSGTLLRGVWVQQPVTSRSAQMAPSEGPRTWLVRTQEEDNEDVLAMLSCPGVVGGERHASVEVDMPGPRATPPPRYMTIYDLEAPEVVSQAEFHAHTAPMLWQGVYRQRPSPWTLRPVTTANQR
jgi:hypothetical protein